MDIFKEVKSQTDMKSVAVQYGFTPNRSGFICCPFHSEKTPSMKLYDSRFYCFGCGESGDVISFVMKLCNLSAIEAAKKLNADFMLNIISDELRQFDPFSRSHPLKLVHSLRNGKSAFARRGNLMNYYKAWEKTAFRLLNGYYRLLKLWYTEFAPVSPDDEPYSLWVQACQQIPLIEHYCLTLIQGSEEERRKLFINNRKEIEKIENDYRKHIRA